MLFRSVLISIRPHRPKKLKLHPIKILSHGSSRNFSSNLMAFLSRQLGGKNEVWPPILILCENIQGTKEISSELNNLKLKHFLLNEVSNDSEEMITNRIWDLNEILVATNVASRGTDFILSPESLALGGLQVILTFFPENLRVQIQAFGRCARQGQPGEVRMILPSVSSSSISFPLATWCDLTGIKDIYELEQQRNKHCLLQSGERKANLITEKERWSESLLFFGNLKSMTRTFKSSYFMESISLLCKEVSAWLFYSSEKKEFKVPKEDFICVSTWKSLQILTSSLINIEQKISQFGFSLSISHWKPAALLLCQALTEHLKLQWSRNWKEEESRNLTKEPALLLSLSKSLLIRILMERDEKVVKLPTRKPKHKAQGVLEGKIWQTFLDRVRMRIKDDIK